MLSFLVQRRKKLKSYLLRRGIRDEIFPHLMFQIKLTLHTIDSLNSLMGKCVFSTFNGFFLNFKIMFYYCLDILQSKIWYKMPKHENQFRYEQFWDGNDKKSGLENGRGKNVQQTFRSKIDSEKFGVRAIREYRLGNSKMTFSFSCSPLPAPLLLWSSLIFVP